MSTPDRNAALRDRRVARVIDREIAPIWHDRFARLIIRNLPQKEGLFVLDIECGPGRLTTEVLQRTDRTTRVLALETSPALLELAKSRVRPEWKRRVYHKPGTFDDIMSMGDASYDLTLANLVLNETHDVGSAITELSRITRPGGRVMATMPMYGSWEEVEDIFAEVLLDAGLKDAARRLKRFRSVRPSPAQLSEVVRGQGIDRKDFVIEHERLQLLFPSGREFLFAPLIEHGPLRLWKAIIGKEGSAAELFWKLKEAIDTYYQGHVFAVTLVAGLINIGLPDPETDQPALTAEFWQHYPQLDTLWGRMANPRGIQSPFSGSDDDDFEFDLDIDFEDPGAGEPEPAAAEPEPIEPEPIEPETIEPETIEPIEPETIEPIEPETIEPESIEPEPVAVDDDAHTQARPAVASAKGLRTELPALVDDDDEDEDALQGATGMYQPVERKPAPVKRATGLPPVQPLGRAKSGLPTGGSGRPTGTSRRPSGKSGLPTRGLPTGGGKVGVRTTTGVPAFRPPRPADDGSGTPSEQKPPRKRTAPPPPPPPRKSGTVPVFKPPTDKKK